MFPFFYKHLKKKSAFSLSVLTFFLTKNFLLSLLLHLQQVWWPHLGALEPHE